PRGSREGLGERLRHSGQGGLVPLLVILLVAAAFLGGRMAGRWLCFAFAPDAAGEGLPDAETAGKRPARPGGDFGRTGARGHGTTANATWPVLIGGQRPVSAVSWNAIRLFWTESLPILRDFPVLGTGFGTFRTIHAYFKTQDLSTGFAMSSVLRCGVEA